MSEPTALGPTWIVPAEVARALATPGSLTMLHRAEALGAKLRPHAHIALRAGRFIADVNFLVPLGPERQDGVALLLSATPLENA